MIRGTAAVALSLAGMSITGKPLPAQSTPAPPQVAEFVTKVRAATERYRDQSVAIADGYRQIGPDFPSMGEHWLSLPLVVRAEVDPLRPPILEYVIVAGRPVLAGVAYTQLVRDSLPHVSLPAPASAWHYHAGSVDEESFILSHAQKHLDADSAGGPRIAVLHAWVWLDNPAGLFATDNWALPWHRLGISPPPGSDRRSPAGHAAALASGGKDYFLTLLRLRHRLPSDIAGSVAEVLERRGRHWRERLRIIAEKDLIPPMAQLSGEWSDLEAELRRYCTACTLSPHAGH